MISNQQQLSAGAGEAHTAASAIGITWCQRYPSSDAELSKFSSSAVGMPFSPLVSEIT